MKKTSSPSKNLFKIYSAGIVAIIAVCAIFVAYQPEGGNATIALAQVYTATNPYGYSTNGYPSNSDSNDPNCNTDESQLVQLQGNFALLQSEASTTEQQIALIDGLATNIVASSTATTTTTSSTASSTDLSDTSGQLSISLNPSSIKPGDTFTITTTVYSSSISNITVAVVQNGQEVGTLVTNDQVNDNSIPYTEQRSFQTSTSLPMGTYTLVVEDSNNINTFNTIALNVNSVGTAVSSTNVATQTVAGNVPTTATSPITTAAQQTTQAVTTTATNQTASDQIAFTAPAANSVQRLGQPVSIQWAYAGNPSGLMDLYARVICAGTSCPTSSFLVASQVPVAAFASSWTIPSYITPYSSVQLYAQQGSTIVGTGPVFVVSN